MYFLLHRKEKKKNICSYINNLQAQPFICFLGSGATYYPLVQTKNSQGININYLSLGHEK